MSERQRPSQEASDRVILDILAQRDRTLSQERLIYALAARAMWLALLIFVVGYNFDLQMAPLILISQFSIAVGILFSSYLSNRRIAMQRRELESAIVNLDKESASFYIQSKYETRPYREYGNMLIYIREEIVWFAIFVIVITAKFISAFRYGLI